MDAGKTQTVDRIRHDHHGWPRHGTHDANQPRSSDTSTPSQRTRAADVPTSDGSARQRPRGVSGRYRLAVASRSLAAGIGGYGCAAAFAAALAVALPLPRSEAVLWGTMLSFAVWSLAAIWAFAARSAGRAWLGILLPASVFGAVVLLAPGTT